MNESKDRICVIVANNTTMNLIHKSNHNKQYINKITN